MDKEKDRNYWPYGRIGEGEPIIKFGLLFSSENSVNITVRRLIVYEIALLFSEEFNIKTDFFFRAYVGFLFLKKSTHPPSYATVL